jgi:hypothetical protein
MGWISKDELAAHIAEYGTHSYHSIVVEVVETESCDAYVDIISNHEHITDDIDRVCIVPCFPVKG